MHRSLFLIIWLMTVLACGACAPSGRGLVDEDASFKIPAIKSAVESNDKKAVPELIQGLTSDDPAVRFYCIEGLRRLTGQTFDYQYYAPDTERELSVQRWRDWLKQSGNKPAGVS
jgi:hypothetical protein